MRLARFAAVLLTVLLLSAGLARADDAVAPEVRALGIESPRRVLFVGNSYLYYGDSLHNHVRRLAIENDKANEKKYGYKSITISGGTLAQHDLAHYLNPNAVGIKQPFEVVVLQGHSAAGLSEKRGAAFVKAVTAFNDLIRASGAKTALYMTHAYTPTHKSYDPAMLRKTAELYVETGNRIGALVIPVGLAFEEAYRRKPDLKLQKDYDGSHPDLIGTYLAACVTYAALYGKSPVGNPYDYYGKIDKDTAAFLQQVAEDTVRKFYGR
ncbi:MAG: DUF4886 domain-containing protein [Burkholderiales bacterium]